VIEPGEIDFTHPDGWEADVNEKREALQEYYPDAHEEWDPHWSEPKGKGVTITIFVDADHASNRSDRRSITGIIIFIETMLDKAFSKRQTLVEASTFGAEFGAARVAVEEAIATRHMMHCIGVPVNGPVGILCDYISVVLNTTGAGSALKKKHISIAYHMIREAIAAGIVTFRHIGTDDNVADIITKVLPGPRTNILGTLEEPHD